MKFRKLKIVVGISLVLFVLVVANIIFIGTFKSNDYQTPVNSNVNNVQPVITKNSSKVATVNNSSDLTATPQKVAPTVQRTKVVQTKRTRAS